MNKTEHDTADTKFSRVTGDTDLRQLFRDELEDIYNAEKQLTKFLPKMAEAAHSPCLREAFEERFLETMNHIILVEAAAKSMNESLKSKPCSGMKGLFQAAQELMKEGKKSSDLDTDLIITIRKMQHYEIGVYSKLLAWADQMGHEEAVYLLDETFADEKAADEEFTEFAEAIAAGTKPIVPSRSFPPTQMPVAA